MSALVGVPKSDEHRMQIGATRIGVTLAEYRAHVASGEKWCYACQAWHPRADFSRRRTAADGLNTICKARALANVLAYQRRRRQEAS